MNFQGQMPFGNITEAKEETILIKMEILMKKILFTTIFILIIPRIFCLPLEINTQDGKKTIQVEEDYIIEQRRFYIENDSHNVEAWLIVEVRYHIDEEWTEWETLQEMPIKYYMSNRDLEDELAVLFDYAVEESIGETDFVFVPIRNSNNQKYWWEKRKYLNFLRKLYIIIKE